MDAEDLSQEALLHAIESFSSLRDPSALVKWLQVVVWRSAMHDAERVRQKRPLWSGGDDPDVLASLDALPDFQVDVRRLLALLDGLTEEERRCLWLRRAEGWHIDEIARETALSISTIQRRVRTAERWLRKQLRDPATVASRNRLNQDLSRNNTPASSPQQRPSRLSRRRRATGPGVTS